MIQVPSPICHGGKDIQATKWGKFKYLEIVPVDNSPSEVQVSCSPKSAPQRNDGRAENAKLWEAKRRCNCDRFIDMETTNVLLKNLFDLQNLEFNEAVRPDREQQIAALRGKIPQPILAHYDRLGDRGKKGVALLQHQTCSGCHVSVPLGVVLELKRGDDLRCCENCGRYLYLLEEIPVPVVAAPVKVSRLGRKKLAHAG